MFSSHVIADVFIKRSRVVYKHVFKLNWTESI